MDPIFEHPVVESAREKIKRFIKQLEKLQQNLGKLVVHLFQMWWQQCFFYYKTG